MVTTRSAQDGDDASPHRSQSGSRSRKPVRRRAADSGSEDDDESEEEEVKVKKGSATKKTSPDEKKKPGKAAQQDSSSGSSWSFTLVALLLLALLAWFFLSGSGGAGKKDAKTLNADPRAVLSLREKRKEQLGSLMRTNFAEQEVAVAKKIVTDVLLRNERQLESGTAERSTVFHFGGGSAGDSCKRMEKVVEEFMFPRAEPKSTLRVAVHKGELDGIRNKIYDQLIQTPRSLIILERADEAQERSLYLIEDAFENAVFDHGGKGVDCTQAVFIIETSLGEGMAETVCGGGACDLSHKEALVRQLKQASQAIWSRQAFVARIREVVPFA